MNEQVEQGGILVAMLAGALICGNIGHKVDMLEYENRITTQAHKILSLDESIMENMGKDNVYAKSNLLELRAKKEEALHRPGAVKEYTQALEIYNPAKQEYREVGPLHSRMFWLGGLLGLAGITYLNYKTDHRHL